MKKKIPLIILAFVVVAGAALWFSQKDPVATNQEPADIAPLPTIATSSLPGVATTPAALAEQTGGSIVPKVSGQTVWRIITADNWDIVFKIQTSWKVSGVYTEDKKLSQVSIGGDSADFFVSRNVHIAEPSKLAYTTTTRTIAGKSVTVHVFEKPNAKYAYYEYFSLPVGTDTYYFQVKSAVASKKEEQDFIDFIALK
jgi:hypothetical protein